MSNQSCIFCKIVKDEKPSHKVYEDDDFLAFLDVNPKSRGHTLLIPKEHYTNIFDIPEELLCDIAKRVKKLSPILKQKLNADGIRIEHAAGDVAGQVIMHFHVHIIPHYEARAKESSGLEDVAKLIRS